VGYLQTLWLDKYGNIREDTQQNKTLDPGKDHIIQFYLDPETSQTRVSCFAVTEDTPYPDTDGLSADSSKSLHEVKAIWEAGLKLSQREANTRKIFTCVHSGIEPDQNLIEFTNRNEGDIGGLLGVKDNETALPLTWLGPTYKERVNNLICFIRGKENVSQDYQGNPTLRSRTIDGRVWKLGDIVNSTPVSISKPVDNYGLLYDDQTYRAYYNKYQNRETVVYVGANDGMLHAFSGGLYSPDCQCFQNPYDVNGYFENIPEGEVGRIEIGDEMWAYIPRNLLPHLKWLASTDYTEKCHVDYVDLKPKIVDAPIFPEDDTHPGGWGTVLIGGLNLGGGEISAGNKTFKSSYFALDVTNPRIPRLLWELDPSELPGLGFTTNLPCVLSVGNQWDPQNRQWQRGKWYLALSSGPTGYDGTSTRPAHLYILDLASGTIIRDFVPTESPSYMNASVALDKAMNYNVDALYFALNYRASGSWKSKMQKITIPQSGQEFDPRSTDYLDTPEQWYLNSLIELADAPVSAPFSVSFDQRNNVWIYCGTGRYMNQADKSSADQNFIFGIKDPFFNADNQTGCYLNYGRQCSADRDRLYNAEDYAVFKTRVEGPDGLNTFSDLLKEARDAEHDGWYRKLCAGSVDPYGNCSLSGPSERVLVKPALVGGILLAPTFAPTKDPCGYGGSGRLFALYFETGTAFKESVTVDKETPQSSEDRIPDVIALGQGLLSGLGIHVGQEDGSTVYGQLSTVKVHQINLLPALSIKSAPIYWKEAE
jgi:type IV pilus assembly protein PilY1